MSEAAQIVAGGPATEPGKEAAGPAQAQTGNADWLGDMANDNEFMSWLGNRGWNKPAAEVAPVMVKSFRELEKFKNKGLEVPKDDATPEQWNEFYGKVGRPPKADEYKLEGLPEGFDKEFVDGFRSWAHENGLTQRQVSGIVGKYLPYAMQRMEAAEAAEVAKVDADFEAWKGKAGAKANEELAVIQRGTKFLGLDAEKVGKIQRALGFEESARLFKLIGTGQSEHPMIDGKSTGMGHMSKEQASVRLAEVMGDVEFARRLQNGDPKAQKELKDLTEWAA